MNQPSRPSSNVQTDVVVSDKRLTKFPQISTRTFFQDMLAYSFPLPKPLKSKFIHWSPKFFRFGCQEIVRVFPTSVVPFVKPPMFIMTRILHPVGSVSIFKIDPQQIHSLKRKKKNNTCCTFLPSRSPCSPLYRKPRYRFNKEKPDCAGEQSCINNITE